MKSITAIHQFSVSCSPGDGISNSMLFIQRLLRGRGLASEIYVMDRPESMRDAVKLYETLEPTPTDLLLIHHGGGNPAARWLQRLPCARVMVYHNITPERFFPADDPLRQTLAYGREQLIDWKHSVNGTIAVSPRNHVELMAAGYPAEKTATIPLLVDLERFSRTTSRERVRQQNNARQLLFVGRLVPHKNPQGLIAMLAELTHMTDQSVRLTLVGEGSPTTIAALYDLAARLRVSDQVEITGKVSDERLVTLYSEADLYVSMSEHEGFGMPLVEAMMHEVPIVAYAAPESGIADTVEGGGLLLNRADPAIVAATAAAVLDDVELQGQVIAAQKTRLKALQPDRLEQQLVDFLRSVGLDPGAGKEPGPAYNSGDG
ncbi:glycosyltransferase family 4 protein [Spiribacter insolitus]|uniref:Glycosyltransferase n=1 Tax=Spiribacter insolitus TaxID=3122417 RepID=A0ABV3TAH8_9GAMM